MESFENQVLLKITSADDPMIEAHGNEKEFDDDDVVERYLFFHIHYSKAYQTLIDLIQK